MAAVNMRSGARFDVRVDRATRWGNPFKVGRDGTREQVVERYRQWLWQQVRAGKVSKADLAALHGKRLGCWCAPLACHADVLTRAAEWAMGQLRLVDWDEEVMGFTAFDPQVARGVERLPAWK